MHPLPLPLPDEDPDPIRVPEERGQLVSPPRLPPTAIGLRTPGRSPRHSPIPRRTTRMQRVALALLGSFLIAGGVPLAVAGALAAIGGFCIALSGVSTVADAL